MYGKNPIINAKNEQMFRTTKDANVSTQVPMKYSPISSEVCFKNSLTEATICYSV